MHPIKSIAVEGVDRLGKDTLIRGILNRLGYLQQIHYQKPELLDFYLNKARKDLGRPDEDLSSEVKKFALHEYQANSFVQMFHMLSSESKFIMNRAHLGEFVYAPRYRQYDGSYVFDLEKRFVNDLGSKFHETTLLVLLHTSDFSFIADDGLSFDFEKKEEEQNDFIRAFERSIIKHKLMIDVNCNGKFVDQDRVLDAVVDAYLHMHLENLPVWFASWRESDGQIIHDVTMQGDVKNAVTIS